MGKKDLCHDRTDGSQKEGCSEDERRAGHGKRNEGRDGDAGPEYRIQGTDEADYDASSGIQDGVQPVLDRRLFTQGDQRDAGNQRNDIKDAVEQGKDLAAEQNQEFVKCLMKETI